MKNQINSEDTPVYTFQPGHAAAKLSAEDRIIFEAIDLCRHRLTQFGVTLSSPKTVKALLTLELSHEEKENFAILFLNNQHQLIEYKVLSTGTIDRATVYPREVAKECLNKNAAAVILAHNHPSHIPEPSTADKALTHKLKECLGLFDIRVLDHIIIGGVDCYSFAEHGLI